MSNELCSWGARACETAEEKTVCVLCECERHEESEWANQSCLYGRWKVECNALRSYQWTGQSCVFVCYNDNFIACQCASVCSHPDSYAVHMSYSMRWIHIFMCLFVDTGSCFQIIILLNPKMYQSKMCNCNVPLFVGNTNLVNYLCWKLSIYWQITRMNSDSFEYGVFLCWWSLYCETTAFHGTSLVLHSAWTC